ncbi:MAG: transglycosylase SLT domain-containing protein [Methylocystis sp.]|nr:transglycosylase SLT domain-containing protein [Methylocystis sp.]
MTHHRYMARRVLATCALTAFICNARAEPTNVCESEMARAADRTGAPLAVLYAVALTETGQRGALHAYAMNIAGKPAFNDSLAQALAAFATARQRGVKMIDVGCMQINHYYHGRNFASLEEMFDPSHNVDYAARFLTSLYAREGSWTAAVARYHAGPGNAPAQKRYVCAVIANMTASGFGASTAQSRAFCATH